MKRHRIGLALGSGGGRGWAHIGVLRELEAAGYEPDMIAGTSVGALVGGLYAAEQLDTLEEWARGLSMFRVLRYLDLSVKRSGMINGGRLFQKLEDVVGERTLESLRARFISVATELETGHEIWFRDGLLSDALTASYALPGLFPPVNVDGQNLVDGALVNPVPVSVCRAYGARLVIAVNLGMEQSGFQLNETGEDALEETGKHKGGVLSRLFRREPDKPDGHSMMGVMVAALNIMQDRIARTRAASDPADIYISPHVQEIGLLEFDKADQAIEAGRLAARQALPAIEQGVEILKLNDWRLAE